MISSITRLATRMNRGFRFGLFFIGCLIANIGAQATILGPHTTAGGKIVNLSNLQWLELTATESLSRDQVEAGAGGLISDGWRYATRTETEDLLDSLWGGTSEDISEDNFDGARWLFDQFGVSNVYGDGYNSGGGSFWNLLFGAALECDASPNRSCLGQVYIEDLLFSTVPGNSTLGANAGWFRDDFGLSTGLTPDNTNGSQGNGSITEAKGSLLVKATSVSSPSGLFLLLLVIVALAISKMTSAQMVRS